MFNLLSLGDSYTIGEGLEQPQSWPYLLKRELASQNLPFNDPKVVAQTGWTAAELEIAVNKAALAVSYDLVTLMVGVNDQYRGHQLEEYERPFRRLLSKAIQLAEAGPKRVIVLSIPDWGATPFGRDRNPAEISQSINRFNLRTAMICREQFVKWVDITPQSRKLGRLSSMVVKDQLHPSEAQYSEWVSVILPAVLNQIQTRGKQ